MRVDRGEVEYAASVVWDVCVNAGPLESTVTVVNQTSYTVPVVFRATIQAHRG